MTAHQQLEAVIGLEVHAQMDTKTKMFCACDNDAFGKLPNTTICPICMGHPGALPALNKAAVAKATKAALAIGCTVLTDNHLDRKNYFYPDLPMGYQISQYDFPLAKGGLVTFGDGKVCRVIRLHIENDAGKLAHAGGRSFCDYNRAGTPLMEIVTEPDLRSAIDAVAFAKELQRILITINVSEADMYKGMMRFDASISLRRKGEKELYPRSEIKNLNSFKSLENALQFEEKRLRELWEKGTPQKSEVTVHWDDDKEVGVILRQKESAADYRYFPEPDVPSLHFDESEIKDAQGSVGALPQERREKYLAAELGAAQVEMLVSEPKLSKFFDTVASHMTDTKRVASIVLTQLLGFLHAANKTLEEGPSAYAVAALLQLVDQGIITGSAAKEVLEEMVQSGKGAEEIIEEKGIKKISDTTTLEAIVKKAIAANPKAVEDLRRGKEKAKGAIVGFVMEETRGQADPAVVNNIVARLV
jgi:aspartyl-tRNA(Asn)/glutamyl-tRNA(Gln) amidotransferase subunit B